MKNEKFLEAMENINDELIFSAMEEPAAKAKTKPFGKIKWTVLAACLAIVLAIPTVAYIKGYTTSYDDENNVYWGSTNYKLHTSDFNEEILEYPGGDYKMLSINLAEKFLGTPLPNNIVLDCAQKNKIWHGDPEKDKDAEGSHCWVHLSVNKETGKLTGVSVYACFVNEKYVSITTNYNTVTENSINEGADFGIKYDGFEDKAPQETYINAAGRTFDVTVFTDGNGEESITAITDIDGYLVYVYFSGGESSEALRETMVEVLEAYN